MTTYSVIIENQRKAKHEYRVDAKSPHDAGVLARHYVARLLGYPWMISRG
ncbi:MAG: hypothetical protein AAF267_22955 [Deinococcota bacterium]